MGWGVEYPSPPPEPPMPVCPECGQECERVYLDVNGRVIGCDNCILELNAYEWLADEMEADRNV